MVTALKTAGQVVVRQIPLGIGMGIGVAIAGGLMSGLGKLLNKGSEAIKARTEKKDLKAAAEYAPQSQAAA